MAICSSWRVASRCPVRWPTAEAYSSRDLIDALQDGFNLLYNDADRR